MHKLFQNRNLTIHLVLFFLLCIAIFATNFPFHGFLTGWDNLHPEFNFPLNFSRAINSVWQANQGLGTYGGHGYAATLPHTAFLFLLSFIVPEMYLRGVFTFFCLFAGGLGIFFLLRKLLGSLSENIKNTSALLAGSYYMLNFGTVQNFYIQLEAFIVQFAALPWLFLTLLSFLQKPNKKRLAVFSFVSLLATVQGFIPPLFFVYMMILCVFLCAYCFDKNFLQKLKISLLVILVTLIINAYWLLPVINFSFTRSATYLNAYNNLSSTQDFILKNQKYGNVTSLVTLKGFISEAIDSSNGGTVFPIFSSWIKHLSLVSVMITGYILFSVILIGIIFAIKNKTIPLRFAFLLGLILLFSLLATDTFPFSYVTKLMQEIPIFKQAFRVAFTKFSLGLGFFYAVFFGFGIAGVIVTIRTVFKRYSKATLITSGLVLPVFAVFLIYFSLPVFSGYFIYPRTKLEIPKSYFDMFDFFKTQDKNGRIANLPQGWNWGWSVYDWGYSGSGFLWYGIEQPIMDRSFDVWGKSNEQYYWELSHIIYSEKYEDLYPLFKKYNISWVTVDKNVIPYLNARGALYTDKIQAFLSISPNYTLVKEFQVQTQGVRPIFVYKVNNSGTGNIHQKEPFTNILPTYDYTVNDQAYSTYGSYVSDPNNKAAVYYPYRTLFSNFRIGENPTNITPNTIKMRDTLLSISAPVPKQFQNYTLDIPPNQLVYEGLTPAAIERNTNSLTVRIQNQKASNYSYMSATDPYFLNHKASDCQSSTLPSILYEQKVVEGNVLQFISKNSENCYTVILPQLFQRYGYVIEVESKHIQGKSLQFAVINSDSRKVEIEYALSSSPQFDKTYVFLPPLKYYGKGYSLVFNNISIGNTETMNDLKSVNLYPLPYELLTNIALKPIGYVPTTNNVISNYQAFDPGWHAYKIQDPRSNIQNLFPFLFGTELKNHVLVNNWANGWTIDNSKFKSQKPALSKTEGSKIIIVFLPQYLEYAGFILLGVGTLVLCSLGLISYRKRSRRYVSPCSKL